MVISGSPPSFDQFLESFSKSIENFTDVRIKDMEKVSLSFFLFFFYFST
jgi:hypothetical protein